ncbi:Translation elongation factor EF-2 [uncultured virus]|nr:Translation elongation factor EF-2 [uncultured virus]
MFVQNLRMDSSKVRNLSCVAHVDHGKTTLTDALANRAGLISDEDAGTKRLTDNREDEKERGITIKSTGITLLYEYQGTDYKVNFIDSPGHVDFSSEVTAALRVTDGALVVVDSVEGVSVQTETVLRQALAEQVKPVLVVNKLDRYIFELQLTPEEAARKIEAIIQSINSLISTYQHEGSGLNLTVSPDLGNVIFGCGLHGWGFTLHDFAKMYIKPGQDIKKVMANLWKSENFAKMVLSPIFKFVNSIMQDKVEEYTKMLEKLNITLTEDDQKKSPNYEIPTKRVSTAGLGPKDRYKFLMKKWLPLSEALLYCIVNHLPSPVEAQKYRVTTLYEGPMDDVFAAGIRNCDPKGPLMIYVSKLFPMENGGRFYAFGRVFSGTVTTGTKVNIMGANYVPGGRDDLFEGKSVQRVVTMIGNKAESVDEVLCGNTVALVGIDQYLVKSGTITDTDGAFPIKTMKFSVSPVVKVAIEPKSAADINKLVEAMKKLSKSDPCVQCYTEETGEHIIAGVGELHLEICLNDLRKYMKSDIKVSEPVVPFRESVSDISSILCLAKSPNKHNRLYLKAEPLHPELVNDIINRVITPNMDQTKLARHLIDKYGWDVNDAKKIWAFGPLGDECTNILVDCTRGVQYMNEIKDNVVAGFQWAVSKGVLCEEPLRGVRFNVMDTTLHSDTIHRGGGQIIPTARRALYASELTAKPIIMEPVYLVDIQVPDNKVGIIYSCIAQKRGRVISENQSIGSLCIVKAYLPVLESFGFNAYIREQTSGQAFPQMIFDHWETMTGDALDPNSKVHQIIKDVRKRKGLKDNIPPLEDYLDKL